MPSIASPTSPRLKARISRQSAAGPDAIGQSRRWVGKLFDFIERGQRATAIECVSAGEDFYLVHGWTREGVVVTGCFGHLTTVVRDWLAAVNSRMLT